MKLSLRLSDALHDELAREAAARGVNVSDVARERLDPSSVSSRDVAELVEDHERRLARLEDLAGV